MMRNKLTLINTYRETVTSLFSEVWVANLENGFIRHWPSTTLYLGTSMASYMTTLNLFQLFKNVVAVRGKIIYMLGFPIRDFFHRKGIYYQTVFGAYGGFSYGVAANPYTPDIKNFFLSFFVRGMQIRSGLVLNTSYFSGTLSAGRFFRRMDSIVAGICQKQSGFDFPFVTGFRAASLEKMFFNYFFSLQQMIRTPTRFVSLLVNNFVHDSDDESNSDISGTESGSENDSDTNPETSVTFVSVPGTRSFSSQVSLDVSANGVALPSDSMGRRDVWFLFSLVIFSNGATSLMCTSLFRSIFVIASDWYSKNLWYILDQPKQYINFMRFIRKFGQGKIFDEETKKNNERALT